MRPLALVLIAVLLLSACGDGDAAETSTPTPEPTDEAEPSPAPTPAPAPDPTPTEDEGPNDDPGEEPGEDDTAEGASTATAHFARIDDSGAWVEPVTTTLDEPTLGVAAASYDLLVEGPPDRPGMETLTGPGVELLGVDIDGEVLTVDLSGALRDNRTGSAGELALSQQLAHTGAQFDGVERVQLLVDGAQVSDLWGHIDWSEPVEPDLWALSPITFDSHDWAEQVSSGDVTVGGEANTFEGNVQLRLLGPDGEVVEETFTTATSGTGERGTWEHTFSLDGTGTWTIEASEEDASGGEGRPAFTTTLELDAA